MPPDEKSVGLWSYSAGSKSAPQRVFERLREKCRLRAQMSQIQAELEELIPQLSHHELAEVRHTLAQAVSDDSEIDALRIQLRAEQEAARTTRKPASVIISRIASVALFEEAERRVLSGTYPSTSGLVQEAILTAYGGEGRRGY
jgi:hypothetical protein